MDEKPRRKITYLKITPKNYRQKLTPLLIRDIKEIDEFTTASNNREGILNYENNLFHKFKTKNQRIYCVFENDILRGVVDGYIEKGVFQRAFMFVDKDHRKKHFGTRLATRVVADMARNEKIFVLGSPHGTVDVLDVVYPKLSQRRTRSTNTKLDSYRKVDHTYSIGRRNQSKNIRQASRVR